MLGGFGKALSASWGDDPSPLSALLRPFWSAGTSAGLPSTREMGYSGASSGKSHKNYQEAGASDVGTGT